MQLAGFGLEGIHELLEKDTRKKQSTDLISTKGPNEEM